MIARINSATRLPTSPQSCSAFSFFALGTGQISLVSCSLMAWLVLKREHGGPRDGNSRQQRCAHNRNDDAAPQRIRFITETNPGAAGGQQHRAEKVICSLDTFFASIHVRLPSRSKSIRKHQNRRSVENRQQTNLLIFIRENS